MTTEQITATTHRRWDDVSPARVAHRATIVVAVALVMLHVLKPEIDPSWRFISEYALGRYGWIMSAVFVTSAVAHVAVVVDLRRYLSSSWPGRFALLALVTSAAGLAIAGMFTTDAVTTAADAVTLSGRLHNVGGTMGLAMPLAVVLVTWQLLKHAAWRHRRRALLIAAGLSIAGTVVSMVSLGILLTRSNGTFGPEVPVGWPTRFELGTYVIWFLTVARRRSAGGRSS